MAKIEQRYMYDPGVNIAAIIDPDGKFHPTHYFKKKYPEAITEKDLADLTKLALEVGKKNPSIALLVIQLFGKVQK